MKIFCKDIEAITWKDSFQALQNKSCQVWLATSLPDIDNIKSLRDILSKEEKIRADGFVFERDSNQFITARGALRVVLSKHLEIPPCEIQFGETNKKKPFIVHPVSPLKFNVSHSHHKTLIAVCNTDVGIDIEMMKPDYKFQEIIKKYFSEKEQHEITASAFPEQLFYKFWSRKEAVLKASGAGILDGLKQNRGMLCREQFFPFK